MNKKPLSWLGGIVITIQLGITQPGLATGLAKNQPNLNSFSGETTCTQINNNSEVSQVDFNQESPNFSSNNFLADLEIAQTEDAYETALKEGIAKYESMDFDGALEDFTSAININPNRGDAYVVRAVVYAEQSLAYCDQKEGNLAQETITKAIADTEKASQIFCEQGHSLCEKTQENIEQMKAVKEQMLQECSP